MRTRVKVVAVAVAAVVVVGGGLVVADVALRGYAEGQIRSSVIASLPPNATGDVDVTLGGGSFLAQYLAGSFDSVTLVSQNLTVDGTPIDVTVVAENVSPDQTKPVPRASITLSLDQAGVNSFVEIPGSDEVTLGDGSVGYQGRFDVFGLPLGYDATATATPVGPDVQLSPTGATLSAGSASIDVGGALKAVISKPISICVAQYLPQGVQLTSIAPTAGHVTIDAVATDLVLTEDALQTTGACN